jgi:hypothetical protein
MFYKVSFFVWLQNESYFKDKNNISKNILQGFTFCVTIKWNPNKQQN